ncbi:hypothetical protein ACFSCW_11615 [Sphingomonas tabacisoli]|uniref:Uncharacterized protein n=1 Tax=Sphingomonas tabacisoli TaxID=2249466 RepID=A0ABW4I3R3_9SPHN
MLEPKSAGGPDLKTLGNLRGKFRALILQNPNYFGNVEGSQFEAVFPLKANTTYENLGCVGYQPQTERLEAVVYVNQPSGYGGGLCGAGTVEYVRFYASFDNGGSWTDLGLGAFNAWDIPQGTEGRKRLEYAVTLRHSFNRRICLFPQIVLIRAILSWNAVPPPNTPNHIPVWGDIHNTHILVEPRRFWFLKDVLKAGELQLKPDIAAVVSEKAEVQVESKTLSLAELTQLYKGQDVPVKRFAHPQLAAFQKSAGLTASLMQPNAGNFLQAAGLDLQGIDFADLFNIGDGNTTFETLECIGYDPNDDSLVGVIRLHRPSGFSGGPCTNGSQEHVTFWADLDGNGSFETCLGTASVRVYDIRDIPRDGLEMAVHLPANLLRHRIPCNKGPRIIPIRAILSWATPIPCATPNATPVWGNRLETLVHVLPGGNIDGLEPLLSSVGGIPVGDIDSNGFAQNAVAVTTGAYFNDAPFGGRINLAGKIVNGTPGTLYRIMIRSHGVGSFVPLSLEPNGITLTVVTPGPVTTATTIHADAQGYYAYQDFSSNHYVEGNILGVWQTGAAEHGKTYDLRVDIKDPGNPAVDIQSNVVVVEVDNVAPTLTLDFTSLAGDCAHFGEGSVFTGNFSATDPHFGGFSFQILPSGPANGVLPTPASGSSVHLGGTIADPGISSAFTLDTNGMEPCGYALILHASDRTNVNSGQTHNSSEDAVGFCLGSPPEG